MVRLGASGTLKPRSRRNEGLLQQIRGPIAIAISPINALNPAIDTCTSIVLKQHSLRDWSRLLGPFNTPPEQGKRAPYWYICTRPQTGT